MRHSTLYTLLFATAICVVCGIAVSSAFVALEERQLINAALDKKKKVLEAAGLTAVGDDPTTERIDELFENIDIVAVELATGNESVEIDAENYNQRRAALDPATSTEAPPNRSAIKRIPNYAQVFKVKEGDQVSMYVLPIEGLGLWGTLYGFLAVEEDFSTVRGITYYQHKETPGLGGEVDNPRWKSLWPGRKALDDQGQPVLTVIKGQAGSPEEDAHRVDGLSGATITSRGITNMLEFWLGEHGFGPYFEKQREARPPSRDLSPTIHTQPSHGLDERAPLGTLLLEPHAPALGDDVVLAAPTGGSGSPHRLHMSPALEVVEERIDRRLAHGEQPSGVRLQRLHQLVSVHLPAMEHGQHCQRRGAAHPLPFQRHIISLSYILRDT